MKFSHQSAVLLHLSLTMQGIEEGRALFHRQNGIGGLGKEVMCLNAVSLGGKMLLDPKYSPGWGTLYQPNQRNKKVKWY